MQKILNKKNILPVFLLLTLLSLVVSIFIFSKYNVLGFDFKESYYAEFISDKSFDELNSKIFEIDKTVYLMDMEGNQYYLMIPDTSKSKDELQKSINEKLETGTDSIVLIKSESIFDKTTVQRLVQAIVLVAIAVVGYFLLNNSSRLRRYERMIFSVDFLIRTAFEVIFAAGLISLLAYFKVFVINREILSFVGAILTASLILKFVEYVIFEHSQQIESKNYVEKYSNSQTNKNILIYIAASILLSILFVVMNRGYAFLTLVSILIFLFSFAGSYAFSELIHINLNARITKLKSITKNKFWN